jgi:hypothetical protein
MGIQFGHIAVLLQFFLVAGACSECHTVLGDDGRQARALIGLIASDKAEQWDEAAKIYQSFAPDSKWKPESSQAMAIIEIRRGKFSEAWKLLAGQSAKLDSANTSMRLGHERLMLWLQLEAGLADQAESQFKRLVTIAINKELGDLERRELCYFLGGVIGMLKSNEDEKSIPVTTLEKGRIAIESLDSKTAVEQFKIGMRSTEQWAAELQTRSHAFSTAGDDQSLSQVDSLVKELEEAIVRQQEAKDRLREANNVKDACKEEARKVRAQQFQIAQEFKKETPGRPREPRLPRRSKPSRPRTEYRTDPDTKQRVYDVQANEIAERRYRMELADYESALRIYERERDSYAARLEQWKQIDTARRAQLQEQKKIVDEALAAKEAEVEKAQAATMQQLELVKESAEAEKQLRRSLTIARIAYQYSNSASGSPKTLFRPSNFQLLNFNSEVTRLAKCLRESSP